MVAGGVLAAFIGPAAAALLHDVVGYQGFSLCYGFFVLLAVLSTLLNLITPAAPPIPRATKAKQTSALRIVMNNPALMLPIGIASLGYGLMNLLMIQASLHMEMGHQAFDDVSSAIRWHVFAMFAPSFFTGYLIAKCGLNTVICAGLTLLIASCGLNIFSSEMSAMSVALILLGLGWNFTYVGGGAMLAKHLNHNPQALEVQGINDLVIAILATAGAFLPSVLLSMAGWTGTNVGCLLLCIALMVLLLLSRYRSTVAAPDADCPARGCGRTDGTH